MDEREWWSSSAKPWDLLEFLGNGASDRKLRLFACACCRRAWPLIRHDWCREALVTMELFLEGGLSHLAAGWTYLKYNEGLRWLIEQPHDQRDTIVVCAVNWAILPLDPKEPENERVDQRRRPLLGACEAAKWAWTAVDRVARHDEGEARDESFGGQLGHLVHDIFGNPFRPVTLSSAWRTPAVLTLAKAAYDNRDLPAGTLDPERLAILADALEDVGCSDDQILSHLRGDGPHWRGCWAIDAILGRS